MSDTIGKPLFECTQSSKSKSRFFGRICQRKRPMVDLIPTLRACRTFVISCRAEAKGRNKSRYEHTSELLNEIDAALALSTEPGEAEGWRDISTAPKDGTWIFLHVPGHGPARAIWRSRIGWESHNSGREITRATHWRPMFGEPAAPLPEDTHHGREPTCAERREDKP